MISIMIGTIAKDNKVVSVTMIDEKLASALYILETTGALVITGMQDCKIKTCFIKIGMELGSTTNTVLELKNIDSKSPL